MSEARSDAPASADATNKRQRAQLLASRRAAASQRQFLEVVTAEEASRRFAAAVRLEPVGVEAVPLAAALGRVLAQDLVAPVDVPGFDRANVDGFAVRAEDTAGASPAVPVRLCLTEDLLTPGVVPRVPVGAGQASLIATGGMLPRGADAVVLIEDTELAVAPAADAVDAAPGAAGALADGDAGEPSDAVDAVCIHRPIAPGAFIAFAGTDIGRGETVLRAGQRLGSREIGVIAALGLAEVAVNRRPRVAIISTGDEILAPGMPPRAGGVYDSNGAILAAAVEELGCEPIRLGAVGDDREALEGVLASALEYDAVLLSGGTSKGAGDLSYEVIARLTDPGIVVHGVAIKPGKPLCLAATAGKAVVILPGFPTSAIFTFHRFVAPVLARLVGAAGGAGLLPSSPPDASGVPGEGTAFAPGRQEPLQPSAAATGSGEPTAGADGASVSATLATRADSERGRTEFLLVGLMPGAQGLAAYPTGKGSGAVTAFSHADGFIIIPAQTEVVAAGTPVRVQLITERLQPADLVTIGSHCVGLDYLLGRLQRAGFTTKSLHVGSQGGLSAVRRGECDLAGCHLLHPQTGRYNQDYLGPGMTLVTGYRRLQGLVFRLDDPRFGACRDASEAVARALADADCVMINRNLGSGTRILIDDLLGSARPAGYAIQSKSHNAVASAVANRRADWGVAIDTVARLYGLGFLPLREEHYDLVLPQDRMQRPAVAHLLGLLAEAHTRDDLRVLGFRL